MNPKNTSKKRPEGSCAPSPRKTTVTIAALLSILAVLCFPELSAQHVKHGLKLCVNTVIPTLFPFLVLSELLVKSSGSLLKGLFSRPMRLLFGVSGAGSFALALGAICGFPVGARTAVGAYDNGLMTKRETERVLAFCSYPSPAFMISTVGATLWRDRTLGILMYVSVLLSGVIYGIVSAFFPVRKDRAELGGRIPKAEPNDNSDGTPLIAILPNAVTSAALATLGICAFVTFFSCAVGLLSHLLSSFLGGALSQALICSVLELTAGAAATTAVHPKKLGLLLCTAAASWSGLSVHLQVAAICAASSRPHPSVRRYITAKVIQTPLAALLMLVALSVRPTLAVCAPASTSAPQSNGASGYAVFMLAAFLIVLLLASVRRINAVRKGSSA